MYTINAIILCLTFLLSSCTALKATFNDAPKAPEAPAPTTVYVEVPAIDPAKVPTVFSKYLSLGHLCPISPEDALTADHVAANYNALGERAPVPLVWADGYGHSGVALERMYSLSRDLSLVANHGDSKFAYWFPISTTNVEVGETVYLAGYDFEDRTTINQRLVEAKVTKVWGAHIIYTPSGKAGSSGGCVFRKDGSVVAINFAGSGGDEHGVGVSIVDPWGVK
jgi:hypothetical protein